LEINLSYIPNLNFSVHVVAIGEAIRSSCLDRITFDENYDEVLTIDGIPYRLQGLCIGGGKKMKKDWSAEKTTGRALKRLISRNLDKMRFKMRKTMQ
jgi:hypothetical protein